MSDGRRWEDVARVVPELAEAVRSRFDANRHHVVATLRADGSPRVSGTEVRFEGGELILGMMPGSRKLADVERDPRVALHAATIDVELHAGDAKVAGRVRRVADDDLRRRILRPDPDAPAVDGEVMALDIDELVITRVRGDRLVIVSWTAVGGVRTVERS